MAGNGLFALAPPTTGTARPLARTRLYTALTCGMALSQLCDVISTLTALRLGLAEVNPITAFVLAGAGVGGFLLAKIAATLILCAAVATLAPRWAIVAAGGSIAITGLVVVSNVLRMV